MKPIENELNNFKIELKLAERKDTTINQYDKYIKEFIEYAGIETKEDINKEILINYKEHLKEKHQDKLNSINIKIIILNKFVTYLGYDKTYNLKIEKQQQQMTLDNVLTLKEYQHLREYAKNTKQYRLYYLMGTLANTGIRVSELKFITAEAVKQGHVKISNKGKSRDILLDGIIDDLKKELLTYCTEEHIKEGIIFKSKNGTPLDNSYIWRQLQRLAGQVRSGLKKSKVHPHSFRHLYAKEYIRKNGNVIDLSNELGHVNLTTTRIYTTQSKTEQRETHRKMRLIK